MKRKLLPAAVLALTVGTPAMAAPFPEPREAGKPAREEKAGKVKPYPLRTCLVSGDGLGEMGNPLVFTHKGQEIKLCCKPCRKDFDKDPARYLRKLKGR